VGSVEGSPVDGSAEETSVRGDTPDGCNEQGGKCTVESMKGGGSEWRVGVTSPEEESQR
jgi:hypothetical protein